MEKGHEHNDYDDVTAPAAPAVAELIQYTTWTQDESRHCPQEPCTAQSQLRGMSLSRRTLRLWLKLSSVSLYLTL